jgi:hypothetical protein
MDAIYKMNIDCGRMGNLEGVFVADTDDIKKLIKSGEEVYFGEVLGKHSEIFCAITKKHLTLVTTDEKFIELFEKYNLSTGFNPFDFINEEE